MPLRRLSPLAFALFIGLALAALGAQCALAAGAIHVTTTGSGNQTGQNWSHAATLQGALASAAPGDEIWVATGVYTPGGTISETFVLPAGVAVYGGFAGTEDARADRDWTANPTVLSGDIGGDDIADARGVVLDPANIRGANSFHVVKVDGTSTPVTDTTVLDGFTITAGNADGNFMDARGGGFYCNGSGAGGVCSPRLENVIFSANWADLGGAMYNDGDEDGESSPSLVNVAFLRNKAGVGGGAVYNDGSDGGESSPSLVNVKFAGNTAGTNGGAMQNLGIGGASSPSLVNVVFSGNSAISGGAMVNDGGNGASSPSLVNVTLSGNRAVLYGGAILNEGGSGGDCSPSLTNVILWGNSVFISGPQIYNKYCTPSITSSLVQGGFTGTGVVNVSSVVTDGGGNVSGDPLFVSPIHPGEAPSTAGDLRLLFGSPAIDIGTNGANSFATDLNGNPRLVDGNGDSIVTVDAGAYEAPAYHPVSVRLDGDGSGNVSREPLGLPCPGGCGTIYAEGTVITLTAAAGTGSTFSGWSGGAQGDSDSVRLTVDGATVVTATFGLNRYPLAINMAGDGNVSATPLLETYAHGTVVTLTAAAEIGSTFSGWSGDALGDAESVSLTMLGPRSVTATFALNHYALDVTTVGQGAVTVEPQKESYAHGTAVTLTAIPKTGWTFSGWSGDANGDEASVNLIMDGVKSATATFVLNYYTLDVTAVGQGAVTVEPRQASYAHGSVVTLAAMPDAGWSFTGWSGDAHGGASPVSLTVDSDKSVSATFAKLQKANSPPSFTGEPALTASAGDLYTYAVSAEDPDAGDMVTLSAPVLPAWLTLTPTGAGIGTLSGTPGAGDAGDNPVRLRVQDGAGAYADQAFTITVSLASVGVGSVQGTVVDETGAGVSGAQVIVTGVRAAGTDAYLRDESTDAAGRYRFDDVPEGDYVLSARAAGFQAPEPISITVTAGETVVAEVMLTKSNEGAAVYLPMIVDDASAAAAAGTGGAVRLVLPAVLNAPAP